jgi:hypothetical protein
MLYRAFLVIVALGLLSACAHNENAASTTAQPESTVAPASESPAASANPEASESPSSSLEASPEAAASGGESASTQCPILANAQVEEVTHLTTKSVKVTSGPDTCEFEFKESPLTHISIEYAPSGGPDELKSTRQGAGGAQAIIGGIAGAASNGNSNAAQAIKSLAAATPPPDLPKVGDDQYAFAAGPATFLIATKGDAYTQVTIGFPPDGVSRWQLLPELARRTLAAH